MSDELTSVELEAVLEFWKNKARSLEDRVISLELIIARLTPTESETAPDSEEE